MQFASLSYRYATVTCHCPQRVIEYDFMLHFVQGISFLLSAKAVSVSKLTYLNLQMRECDTRGARLGSSGND